MEPNDILTEFSELLDNLKLDDEEIRSIMTGIVKNMLDDSYWLQLEEEPLTNLLFDSISLYGLTNWELFPRVIGPVYLYAIEFVAVQTRMDLENSIRQKVETNELSLNAFMPFLMLETERSIVATTAIDFVMIPAPPDDDPIAWPKRLVSDLEARMPTNIGAVFGGLVNLGDHRVNEMLREIKWTISDNEVGVAAQSGTGFPCIATFEFWLDWAEELTVAGLQETGLYGECASALVLLARSMRHEYFADITRNFGYLNTSDKIDTPIDVRRQLTLHEVGEQYAERFYTLEETELPPRLMSDVIRHFELEPRAPLEERYTMQ